MRTLDIAKDICFEDDSFYQASLSLSVKLLPNPTALRKKPTLSLGRGHFGLNLPNHLLLKCFQEVNYFLKGYFIILGKSLIDICREMSISLNYESEEFIIFLNHILDSLEPSMSKLYLAHCPEDCRYSIHFLSILQ